MQIKINVLPNPDSSRGGLLKWMFGKNLPGLTGLPILNSCCYQLCMYVFKPTVRAVLRLCLSASLCHSVPVSLWYSQPLWSRGVSPCAAPPSPPPRLSENICSVSHLLGCRGKKNKLGSYFLSILMRKQCIMGYCTILRPINSINYTLLHTCINKMNGITSKIKVQYVHTIITTTALTWGVGEKTCKRQQQLGNKITLSSR